MVNLTRNENLTFPERMCLTINMNEHDKYTLLNLVNACSDLSLALTYALANQEGSNAVLLVQHSRSLNHSIDCHYRVNDT